MTVERGRFLAEHVRTLVERLHRAITAGEKMEPDFDDAVAVQSALDAARLSSDAGTWVSVEIPEAAATNA